MVEGAITHPSGGRGRKGGQFFFQMILKTGNRLENKPFQV
jgi:hypothetical protein